MADAPPDALPEALPDGWGPTTPVDDTLVRAGVESLADRMRHMARALDRDVVESDGWTAASLASSGMFSTGLVITRPVRDWADVVDALIGLAPAGTPKLLISPFTTPDLGPVGLVPVGHPPFMARPPAATSPSRVDGLEIRRVQHPADLRTFERMLIEGYPIPDMDAAALPVLFPDGYLEGDSTAYLGVLDGEPVGAAAAHVAAGVNQVEFIAVHPSARGRGIGKALTAAATTTAPQLPAVLIASDDGRPVYEALGYLALVRWTLWLAP
jgi:GNAT superfamily N-acetyltransferase